MVGGTGAFGERLVRGLASTTALRVVVAARGIERAQALAASLATNRLIAARLDADDVTAAQLVALGAWLVVDTAGPFRPGRDRLARAAIAARAHYLDLADNRAFVAGFAAELDAAARASGVVALTGASSTPALSCAVLDQLTAGWRRVHAVEIAILPGNRAPRGLAVVRSILSWAGQPVTVLHEGSWLSRPGWGLTRLVAVPGGRRWAALADTPDLDAVPARYPGVRTALFRAGLELKLLHLGLLALTLPVRAARRVGLPLSLAPLAPALRRVADWFAGFGTDRGFMLVAAAGHDEAGSPIHRSWTLTAEAGDGPAIPTLPALAAIRALANGTLCPPGARPCIGVLTLEQIACEFTPYRITAATEPGPAPLFARVLGPAAFAALPACLRTVHGGGIFQGRASVERGNGLVAKMLATLFGFPATTPSVPVRVTVEPDGDGEVWARVFGSNAFRSRMRASASGLEECFGPFAFRLALQSNADGLSMRLLGWRCWALPLPRRLAPITAARESVDAQGRFRFDVSVSLPLLGALIAYRGWLEADPTGFSKNTRA